MGNGKMHQPGRGTFRFEKVQRNPDAIVPKDGNRVAMWKMSGVEQPVVPGKTDKSGPVSLLQNSYLASTQTVAPEVWSSEFPNVLHGGGGGLLDREQWG